MGINTRRNFFGKIAAMAAFVTGAPKLFAQQTFAAGASNIGSTLVGASGKDTDLRTQISG